MSCLACEPKCEAQASKIVAAFIPTVKGWVKIKPVFMWIEFKKICYDLGFTSQEIEMSIRNFTA